MATVVWAPQPRQKIFVTCPFDEILYGGAAGGGKTDGLLGDFLNHANLYGKNAVGVLFRKSFPEFEEVLRRSQEIYGAIGATYKDKSKSWTFPNGATQRLAYIESYDDALQHRGFQYSHASWDELTLWATDEEYTFIKSRMRSAAGVPTRIVSTTNPGGPGHDWVMKHWYVDVYPNGMKPFHTYLDLDKNIAFEDKELDKCKVSELPTNIKRKTRIFIPGKLADNAYLDNDGEYRACLLSMPEAQRKMLLDGRWDVVEGAFFKEWNPSVHIVKSFKPPKDWARWMAGDWGSSKPYCCLWGATSPNGDVYIYRELYGSDGKPNVGNRKGAYEVGQIIRSLELEADEWITERYLDASCWDDLGLGTTIAAQFASPQGGSIHFQKSQKKNKAGSISLLRDYLKVVNGTSRLKVMDVAANLIRTLPAMQMNRVNLEQYDTDLEDHAVDCCLYLLRKNIKTLEDQQREHSVTLRNKKLLQQFGSFGCQ